MAAELALLPVRAVLALGAIGWDAAVQQLAQRAGLPPPRPRPRFAHGAETAPSAPSRLLGCYHVSQQNTFTGRLTPAMLDGVLARAVASVTEAQGGATADGPVSVRAAAPCTQDGCERRSHHHTRSAALPALAIADADGVRRTVTGIDSTTTVGALADLLGIAGHRFVTDRRTARCPVRSASRTGIVQGSTVRPGVADDDDLMARRNACPGRLRAARPSGRPGAPRSPRRVPGRSRSSSSRADRPSARRWPSPLGRHVVGRAAGAAVRLLDERAELHHGALDIDGTGVRFTQLTGRTPCDVGGTADRRPRRAADVGPRGVTDQRATVGGSATAVTAAATLRRPPGGPVAAHAAPGAPPPSTLGAAAVEVPAGDRPRRPRGAAGLLAMVAPMLAGVRGRCRAAQSDVPRALRRRRAGARWRPASSAWRRIVVVTGVVRSSAVRR